MSIFSVTGSIFLARPMRPGRSGLRISRSGAPLFSFRDSLYYLPVKIGRFTTVVGCGGRALLCAA